MLVEFSLVISALYILSAVAQPTTSDLPQTIASLPVFRSSLRDCAKGCFWYTIGTLTASSDGVADTLGCPYTAGPSGALDDCWCNPNLQQVATNYLSSCISIACSHDTGVFVSDQALGVSLYENYCTSKGYTVAMASGSQSTAAAATTTVSGDGASSSSESSTLSRTSTTWTTSSSNSVPFSTSASSPASILSSSPTATLVSTSTPAGFDRSDILAIVFGTLSAIIAIVIGIWQGRSGSLTRTTIHKWSRESA